MNTNQLQTLYYQLVYMETEHERLTASFIEQLPTPALIDARWNAMQQLFQIRRQLEKATRTAQNY